MTTGERIRLRREQLGLSKTELARRVGYTKSAITKIEARGTLKPSKIADFAKVLNTTVADLVDGGDDTDELTREIISRIKKLDQVDKEIINRILKLDQIDKYRILERMDTMLENEKYHPQSLVANQVDAGVDVSKQSIGKRKE